MNAISNRITEVKDQIAELVERLEENGSYALNFYEEYSDDFATSEYLDDMIHEWADSQVDIYYNSLLTWVREYGVSVDYIRRSVAEGLVDCKEFDIYKAIQMAQYLFYSDEVYTERSTLGDLYKLHNELAELERAQVA